MSDAGEPKRETEADDGHRVQRIVLRIAAALTASSTLFTGIFWLSTGDPWQLATTCGTILTTSALLVALWFLSRGQHSLSARIATAGAAISVVMGSITNPADIALPIMASSLAILMLVPPTLFAGQRMTRGWLGTLTVMFYVGIGTRIAIRGNDLAQSSDEIWVALTAPVICLLIQWLLTKRLLSQLESALSDSERLRESLEKQNIELDHSRVAAEQANRSKSVFLANMSHELRTPLNAVIGYSEMLAEDAEDAGHEQMLADIRKIEGAGQQLLALINDVLDMAKIEAGHATMHIERVETASLIAELELVAAPLVLNKNNTFSVSFEGTPEYMHTDWTKLRQVLTNLISNAAKFTQDGLITLRVQRTEFEGVPAVAFAVEDDGVGMDESAQSRVFESFVQADESTTRTHGGTGLGLSLVTQLTELLGGSVALESAPGEGSTFTITLPLSLIGRQGADAPERVDEG